MSFFEELAVCSSNVFVFGNLAILAFSLELCDEWSKKVSFCFISSIFRRNLRLPRRLLAALVTEKLELEGEEEEEEETLVNIDTIFECQGNFTNCKWEVEIHVRTYVREHQTALNFSQ